MLYGSRSSHGGEKKEELYPYLRVNHGFQLACRGGGLLSPVACRLRLKPEAVGLGLGEVLLVVRKRFFFVCCQDKGVPDP